MAPRKITKIVRGVKDKNPMKIIGQKDFVFQKLHSITNQIKSNLFLYNIQHNFHVYINTI